MPRTQFERRTNALLVSDALNNLDVNTYVNDRNDICIDGFKMSLSSRFSALSHIWHAFNVDTRSCYASYVSGSAFKLVNARAYHHGTMLIDAKLKDLKGVLSNEKVRYLISFETAERVWLIQLIELAFQASSMVSKGVESVPSPVRNLREWDFFLDHQSFFEAVADQFIHVYGGKKNINLVNENELQENDFVKKSFEELKSWDWQWGQTPEFTIQIDGSFDWGTIVRTLLIHLFESFALRLTIIDTSG